MNKVTTALVGLGLVSMASLAQANTVIYLTGSTAARSYIYNMMTETSGGLFTGGATVVEPTSGASGSSNQIVYEGTISGVSGTVDISCDFTGSEAGIASTAGQNLTQDIPNDPNLTGSGSDQSTYAIPGVGAAATFYQPNGSGGWNAPASLPSGAFPDLSMADTSQAVSRTPDTGSTALHDFGTVGVVPFTFMKGYESSPDSSWNDCVNITTAQINQALSGNGALTANYITGNSADTDYVVVCGRNFGSGTRVNTFLNGASYPLLDQVGQYAWNSGYPVTPAASQGTLTFGGVNGSGTGASATFSTVPSAYAPGAALVSVGDDGFDSGGGVSQCMNVDGNPTATANANGGISVLMIGYLGISDAQKAVTDGNGGSAGGDAVPLTYNGVYESDANVENGSYPYWGQEHLLGQASEFNAGGAVATVGTDLFNSIKSYIGTKGTATGNFQSNEAGQSLLVPWSKMNVTRSTDSGFPAQTGN